LLFLRSVAGDGSIGACSFPSPISPSRLCCVLVGPDALTRERSPSIRRQIDPQVSRHLEQQRPVRQRRDPLVLLIHGERDVDSRPATRRVERRGRRRGLVIAAARSGARDSPAPSTTKTKRMNLLILSPLPSIRLPPPDCSRAKGTQNAEQTNEAWPIGCGPAQGLRPFGMTSTTNRRRVPRLRAERPRRAPWRAESRSHSPRPRRRRTSRPHSSSCARSDRSRR
jgi:hypothetical protein